eukprot:SM000042S15343  [mRNA]  locus=s42:414870:423136:- [translate_table: standard]
MHEEGLYYGWHPPESDKSCAYQDENGSPIFENNAISVVARGIKQGQEAHDTPGPTSWLRVNVPVLSLQRMSMPAISSMAVIRFTIAPCSCQDANQTSANSGLEGSASNVSKIEGTCLARWWEPMAMVTDSTVGMAIGMPPIKSTRRLLMPFLYLRFYPQQPSKLEDALDKVTTIHRPSGSDPADPLYPPALPKNVCTPVAITTACKSPCLHEPRICRDDVAAPDANEISRHKVRCLHLLPGSVTEDLLTKALRACLELIPDLVHGGMFLFDIQSAAHTLEVRRRSAYIDEQAFTGPHFLLAKLVLRGRSTGIEPISGRLHKGQPLKPLGISVRVTAARPLLVMADCSSHSQGRIR